MKRKTKTTFEIQDYEILYTTDHPDSKHFKVFFKGKEITNVTALVRDSRFKNE